MVMTEEQIEMVLLFEFLFLPSYNEDWFGAIVQVSNATFTR